MKSMIRFCMVMFLFVSMNMLAQSDMSALKSTFQKINDDWGKAMVAGDWTKVGTFYTDDALSMPPNMPVQKGRNEIVTENQKNVKEGMKFVDFKATTNEVFGNGDLAVEQGSYTITFIPPNMTDQMTDHGKYVNVWQKQSDGNWKLKSEIWNSDAPMNMQQAGAKEKNVHDEKMDTDMQKDKDIK